MDFWSWFDATTPRVGEGPGEKESLSDVRWIPADENPFGVDIVDCRPLSCTAMLASQDREVAKRYVRLRASGGEELCGSKPKDAETWACDLRYPCGGECRDGPLFKSAVMEDKWDIYLHEGHFYFARSWSGELGYRARVVLHEREARLSAVEAPREHFGNDASFSIAVVDYLIRSHVFQLPVPHPLPESISRDAVGIALFSFSLHGRYGMFGTFAETTQLRVPPRKPVRPV